MSVRLAVTLMCCVQTTERIKLPFRVRVTPKHCDIIVLHSGPVPPKIGVRGTSPKFTQRALPQSHLAVYISPASCNAKGSNLHAVPCIYAAIRACFGKVKGTKRT